MVYPGQVQAVRFGSIDENVILISGPAVVPNGSNVSITESELTGYGHVCGMKFKLKGKGFPKVL